MIGLPPPFPLLWPDGKKRTTSYQRQKGHFNTATVAAALDDLSSEMSRCSIRYYELTANFSGRGNAMGRVDDPGAALWFLAPKSDITATQNLMTIACDKFDTICQNIRGISLTMQRLRLVDEIGAYSFVQAVKGAEALPPPDPPWWTTLHITEQTPLAIAELAYRELSKAAHPDAGGDRVAWDRLSRAIEQARVAKS